MSWTYRSLIRIFPRNTGLINVFQPVGSTVVFTAAPQFRPDAQVIVNFGTTTISFA